MAAPPATVAAPVVNRMCHGCSGQWQEAGTLGVIQHPNSTDPIMKYSLLATLLLSASVVSAPLFAQETGEKPANRRGSPLGNEMKTVEKAIEAVSDFLKKPEGDAPIAEVVAAQEALHNAKQEKPRLTARQPEDKQDKFVTAYKVEINKAVRATLDLEDALVQKDWKAAAKAVDALEKLEKEGHKEFKGRRGGAPGGQRGEGGEGRGGEGRGGEASTGKGGGK